MPRHAAQSRSERCTRQSRCFLRNVRIETIGLGIVRFFGIYFSQLTMVARATSSGKFAKGSSSKASLGCRSSSRAIRKRCWSSGLSTSWGSMESGLELYLGLSSSSHVRRGADSMEVGVGCPATHIHSLGN